MIKRFKSDETITNDDTLDNINRDIYDIETEKEKILQIVRKETPGYKKHIICEFKNKEVQKYIGDLYKSMDVIQKEYAELLKESRWAINKIGNDYTPEFKAKMDKVEVDLNGVQEELQRIESSSRDITIDQIGLFGGKIKNYIKQVKNNNLSSKTKSKSNAKSKSNSKSKSRSKSKSKCKNKTKKILKIKHYHQ
jgi:hypothetical protein